MMLITTLRAAAICLLITPVVSAQMSTNDPDLDDTIECWASHIRAQHVVLERLINANFDDASVDLHNHLVDRTTVLAEKLVGKHSVDGEKTIKNPDVANRMKERRSQVVAEANTLIEAGDENSMSQAIAQANLCQGVIS